MARLFSGADGGSVRREVGTGTGVGSVALGASGLGSGGLFLLLDTLGVHVGVLEHVAESRLNLADDRLGSTARGLVGRGMRAGVRAGVRAGGMSAVGGVAGGGGVCTGDAGLADTTLVVTTQIPLVGTSSNGVGPSRRMRTSLVACQRVVRIVNAIACQRVMRVVGIVGARTHSTDVAGASVGAGDPRRSVGTSASHASVANTVLLMTTQVSVMGTTSHGVGSRRGVGPSLVTGHRVVRVVDTIASQRVMGVVGVGAGGANVTRTSVGGARSGVGASCVASHRIVSVGTTIAGHRVMGVVGVMGVGARGDTSTGMTSAWMLLLVSTELAVLRAASNRVSSRRWVRASLVTRQRVVGVDDAVASERVVGVMGGIARHGVVGVGVVVSVGSHCVRVD